MPPLKKILLLLLCSAMYSLCMAQESERSEIVSLTDRALKSNESYKFRESLTLSRQALKKALELNDNVLITRIYNIIGANFEDLSEIPNAIEYYNKALKYAKLADSDSLQSIVYNNLGNIYYYNKKASKEGALYYDKALKHAELADDKYGLLITRLNLALTNYDLNNKELGLKHLEWVDRAHRSVGDDYSKPIYLIAKANYSYYLRQPEQAKKYYEEAIKLAGASGFRQELAWAYDDYAKFLVDQKSFEKAYQYLRTSKRIEDSIYENEKILRASQEGLNLQLDEYRRSYSKMEAEKEVQDFSLRKSRIIQLLFIGISLILLVLLYYVYKNARLKRQHNEDLEKANQELQIAKEKAEEASSLKSQFVSTISHELRTPLYGVVGITNMILDEHRELAGSQHLNSLKFSAKYLLSLVNDILQINKIEENRLTLENHAFNVADEVGTIKNSLEFLANKNNNELIAEIDTDIPELLIGDKLRLAQILMNLVSNALKFTNNGEVVVSVEQQRVEGKKHFLKFTVRDTGIGIAKADQEKIFDKFVQIERKNDDYQGTGLGLPIVKKLIAVFESELYLESKESEGTTFSFTIPFEFDPEKSNDIINNIEVDLSSGHIFHILVVEDNKINQVVTKKIIENNNYRCTIADDGFSALEILENQSFDIILMDINMPGINGFETTRRIRQKGIATPILALTAFDKEEVTEEALSSGMNDIIVKPFEPVKLFRIIHNLIHRKA